MVKDRMKTEQELSLLAQRVEEALEQLSADADGCVQLADSVLKDLRITLRATSAGTVHGPLIGALEKAKKIRSKGGPLHRLKVGNGFITIGPRPKFRAIHSMRSRGITHILTILGESEGAFEIRNQARKAGIEWLWLPLECAQQPSNQWLPKIHDLYQQLAKILDKGGGVYVHCSAGIHRTGMIVYGFLRSIGFSRSEAKDALSKLRSATATDVGEDRLAWADQFADKQTGD
ncbi:MAG: dual specificity protein phosphatase family protein [bacterium]|jgi:protein tyrosine phosphatase (PTP) superfamily phosphohydrolase (DUF442 family)|nr:dual specificity protein phosphatase family protein [candidate division KSB1 bacterium]MDH7561534.1 dual specificity protein phosphatase family protein [bacterium]